jgi:hypothetical protein
MTTPNIEALERLCRLLAEQIAVEKAAPVLQRFVEIRLDMCNWGRSEPYRADCGSTACALGLACLDPWFQERGLVLVSSDGDIARTLDDLKRHPGKRLFPIHRDPNNPDTGRDPFDWPHEYNAGASFFGIKPWQARGLFDPEEYGRGERNSPQAVLNRVEELLAQLKLTAEARREAGLT